MQSLEQRVRTYTYFDIVDFEKTLTEYQGNWQAGLWLEWSNC